MRSWPSTLRARLTLWYTVLLGIPLTVFALVCYLAVAATLTGRTDRFIGDALTAFERELGAERRAALSLDEAMRRTAQEMHFRDLHILIVDSAGAIIARTPIAAAQGPGDIHPSREVMTRMVVELRQGGSERPLAATLPGAGGNYRVISHPMVLDGRRFTLGGVYALAELEGVLQRIRAPFLVAIPLLILCAATGGSLLAKRSLAPVAAMGARAAEISATNMSERLPVGGGDELVGLARVVNDLLDRLERAFAQQQRFVADASHELRTPTAILRTEADVTLSHTDRSEAEYRASLTVMRDAAGRLTRIVEDLFLLARADGGHLGARKEPLYLEDVVHDTARAMQSVADRRGVRLLIGDLTEAPSQGDADLLGRLMLNLLDNAIKYSASGGEVNVGMRIAGHLCLIEVQDAGPGIPAEVQERVFERFYRADAARSRGDAGGGSGAGLGLAIARRIAELHGGRLELIESHPGRTVFRLTLPLEEAAAPAPAGVV